MKKTRLGLLVCVAAAMFFSMTGSYAGEVDGKGNPVPGGQNGNSECSYSGQQDDAAADAGVFKSDRTQSWGQLLNETRLFLIKIAGFTPGSKFGLGDLGSCNPNAE